MKKISALLWIGILINALLVGVAWFNSNSVGDGYDYDYSAKVWSIVFPFFIVAIIIQLSSIPLLFKSPKAGKVLAGIGSFAMLPIGLVFFMGYVSSCEKISNQSMNEFSIDEMADDDLKLNFKTSPFFINGIIFLVLGGGIMMMGVGTGGILIGAGVLALINGFRLSDRVVIGLSRQDVIITPGLYSGTYRIPPGDIVVTHIDNRLFKLHIKSADVNKQCTLRKAWLAGENTAATLETILSKITVQSVS